MLNRISCQLKVARRMPRGVGLLLSGCYYVLWDAWDASHLILEIIGTMCTWSPPTFFSWLSFFAGHFGKLTVLLRTWLNIMGEGKKNREGIG